MTKSTGRRRARRSFLGTALLLLPGLLRESRAQPPPRVHRVAYVNPRPEDVDVFRKRMNELGFVEPRNLDLRIFIERSLFRSEENVRLAIAWNPHVIVAQSLALQHLQRLAPAIPIVFQKARQPLEDRFVKDLAHPGGNMTGVISLGEDEKLLELARILVPGAKRVAALVDSRSTGDFLESRLSILRQIAENMGVELVIVDISRFPGGVKGALDSLGPTSAHALFTLGNFSADSFAPPGTGRAFQMRTRIPYISQVERIAQEGAVMSYSPDMREHVRLVADQTARILNGAAPSTLPVVGNTRFRLVINRRSATEMGIALSPEILLRADRVID